MRYGHQSLADAIKADIHDRLGAYSDADGALIGIDRAGNIAMDWNAVGLFRGYATDTEGPLVAEYAGPPRHSRLQSTLPKAEETSHPPPIKLCADAASLFRSVRRSTQPLAAGDCARIIPTA